MLCTQKPGSFQFHSEMIGVKIPPSGSGSIPLLKNELLQVLPIITWEFLASPK